MKTYEWKHMTYSLEVNVKEFLSIFSFDNEDIDNHAQEIADVIIGEELEREHVKRQAIDEQLFGKT